MQKNTKLNLNQTDPSNTSDRTTDPSNTSDRTTDPSNTSVRTAHMCLCAYLCIQWRQPRHV